MPLLRRPSSKAISTVVAERDDPTLPVILEFQSPSTAITGMANPPLARGMVWVIASMFAAIVLAMVLIPVDMAVTAQAIVISQSSTIVVQPLDTSIIRSVNVQQGERVKAGQVLATLDPTFAAADLSALVAQVSTLQAQVTRLRAEADGRPFTYSGTNPDLALQAAMFGQRQAEYNFRIENYNQKISSLAATLARANSDIEGYRSRLSVATDIEKMRRELERLQAGSKLNTLVALDNRVEIERNMRSAQEVANGAQRDLAAMVAERDGFAQNWRADVSDKLTDATGKLSDARESLNKAQLHRQLVELRADQDATVLTVAKVSVGSVLQSGQELMTLVPADATLEVEANIAGSDNGYAHVGDPVMIKFDTLPYRTYGMAYGTVRTISADSFTGQTEQRNPTGSVAVPNTSTTPYYRARITIDRVDLHDTPDAFRVAPGMPITADIMVGKRTVLQYLLGRVLPLTSEAFREP